MLLGAPKIKYLGGEHIPKWGFWIILGKTFVQAIAYRQYKRKFAQANEANLKKNRLKTATFWVQV